jgi:hypothetical protein
MSFHPEKCEVIHITNKIKHVIRSDYIIHGHKLQIVDQSKYLGVTITKNLSWNPHINNICKKANSTQAFLQRNFKSKSCPRNVKAQAYQTLVLLNYLLYFISGSFFQVRDLFCSSLNRNIVISTICHESLV